MIVVLVLDNKAAHVQASPFVYTQPLENGLYSLEALYLTLDDVNTDTVLILPEDAEIEEGTAITDEIRKQAKPFALFERATKEQAAADALGLLLRTSVADGSISDDELLRIAPALDDREWRPGLTVEVGDIYALGGSLWRCVTAHTTQGDWRPEQTPALWRRIDATEPGAKRVWKTQTDYIRGDIVYYPDVASKAYACITGHTSLAGWEPPNVPALWELCNTYLIKGEGTKTKTRSTDD